MRIAIITDIHEDFISLTEALRKIEKYRVDEIVCLGDISGYSVPHYTYFESRNAQQCLALIRANCKTIVLGNHDLYAGSIIPNTNAFFDFPKNWYQLDYHQKHKLAKNSIWLHEETDLDPLYTKEDIAYLKTLPQYATLNYSGINVLVSHYFYPNISGIKKEFYTYQDEFKPHFEFMEGEKCTLSFTGHSHVKGFFSINKKRYKQYGYKRIDLKTETQCYGLPPITNQQKNSGFSIVDFDELTLQVIRL